MKSISNKVKIKSGIKETSSESLRNSVLRNTKFTNGVGRNKNRNEIVNVFNPISVKVFKPLKFLTKFIN
jgi:hypothetical protein